MREGLAAFTYGGCWSALSELLPRAAQSFELERQALLAWPYFEAQLEGERVGFVHARSSKLGALPLLLLHGYSASLAELQDQIEPLREHERGGSMGALVQPELWRESIRRWAGQLA